MIQAINPVRKYTRPDGLPHMFCPGCGCGQIMNFFLQAVDDLGINPKNLVGIGGVGCAARIPIYMEMDALHGVHGRTLGWASGIKMQNPDLDIVIFAGDGDAASIGGNHFIQAARRNLDVTFIIVNNLNFAMTGGQVAPTTPENLVTMTTPYGSSEPPLDLCELAVTAGATYVSRWTTSHPHQTIKAFKEAFSHKGFSMVEVISQCPTHFGRYALGTGDPVKVVNWINERSINRKEAEKLSKEEKKEKFILGKFTEIEEKVHSGSTSYETE